MIHTLQKKFVLSAMLAITILLLVLIGAINIANALLLNRQTDQLMEILSKTSDHLPPHGLPNDGPSWVLTPPVTQDDALSARYFLVRLDQNGQVIDVNVSRISSVSEEEAAAYGLQADRTQGQIAHFRYCAVSSPSGTTLIFLDVSGQIRSTLNVLLLSFLIATVCWGLMLLLVILLSRRAIRPIAEGMEKQKRFVTDAGHEIKTPLAIILANTDALELHAGESKWTRNIRAQTFRLNRLMQSLLLLSRMEEREPRRTMEDCSLSSLVEDAVQAFTPAIEAGDISFSSEISPDVIIRGEREALTQLCSILLDNAVKYTPQGGKIHLTLQPSGNGGTLQIRNTASSLSGDDCAKWFDRFYRSDSARTQSKGGCGIGLAIAKAIVEAHGGIISAELPEQNTVLLTVKI